MVLSYNLPGNRTPPLLRDRALLTMLLSHLGLSICLRIGNGIPSHPMVVLMMKITIGSHFLVYDNVYDNTLQGILKTTIDISTVVKGWRC